VKVNLLEREPYYTLCNIGGNAKRTSQEIPFSIKGQVLEGKNLKGIESDIVLGPLGGNDGKGM